MMCWIVLNYVFAECCWSARSCGYHCWNTHTKQVNLTISYHLVKSSVIDFLVFKQIVKGKTCAHSGRMNLNNSRLEVVVHITVYKHAKRLDVNIVIIYMVFTWNLGSGNLLLKCSPSCHQRSEVLIIYCLLCLWVLMVLWLSISNKVHLERFFKASRS